MSESTRRVLSGRGIMCQSAIVLAVSLGGWLEQAPAQGTAVLDDTQIVNALAPELADARVSTVEALTAERRAMFESGEGLGFRFEQDLNGDGVTDLLLLGDYREGIVHSVFALIATKSDGRWRRVGLLTFDEDFIVGQLGAAGAVVAFCLHCDYGGLLKWTGSSYAYEPYEPGPKAHDAEGEER